jgi:hypothetical protein
VLSGIGQVVKRAVGDEAFFLQALGRDLALKDAALVVRDAIHVGAQGVEVGLQLGQDRACDFGDHGQTVATADPASHGGFSGSVRADKVDAHAALGLTA